jgi:hypothetical protein
VAIVAIRHGTGHRHEGSTCPSLDDGDHVPRCSCTSVRGVAGHRGRALAGVAVGAVNGSLVAFAGMQPIIATLGVLVAGRGLALVFANGGLTELFDPTLDSLGNDSVLGVPISVLLVLASPSSPASWFAGPRSAGSCSRSAATGPRRRSPACPSSGRSSPCTS